MGAMVRVSGLLVFALEFCSLRGENLCLAAFYFPILDAGSF